MPDLKVIQGGREQPTNQSNAVYDRVDRDVFGIPPNLITGLLTGLLGAFAGFASLIVYFYVWEPHHYVSPEWLVFALLGGIVGVFLRIERPIIREMRYRNNKNWQTEQL